MVRVGRWDGNKGVNKERFFHQLYVCENLVEAESVAGTQCNNISHYCKFHAYILDH